MKLSLRSLAVLPLASLLLASCQSPHPGTAGSEDEVIEKQVYAHVMVSFRNKRISGEWHGWNHSNQAVTNNPEIVGEDGNPQIASVFTPAMGLYDMLDPATAEAHCRLAKAAGIDGFWFDVVFAPDTEWRGDAVQLYVDAMQRHGLKGAIVYEDKGHWVWNPTITNREDAVQASLSDLDAWLEMMEPVQVKVNGKPLIGFFSYEDDIPGKGVSRLQPGELRPWLESFDENERPVLVSSWFTPAYKHVLAGQYDWIWLNGTAKDPYTTWMSLDDIKRVQQDRDRQREQWEAEGLTSIHIGGVWPGFDSLGSWGFGGGPQYADRAGGDTYAYQWDVIENSEADIVQICTWNDWFEGTVIEPTVEEDFTYLDMTRERVGQWKGEKPAKGNFRRILLDYFRDKKQPKAE